MANPRLIKEAAALLIAPATVPAMDLGRWLVGRGAEDLRFEIHQLWPALYFGTLLWLGLALLVLIARDRAPGWNLLLAAVATGLVIFAVAAALGGGEPWRGFLESGWFFFLGPQMLLLAPAGGYFGLRRLLGASGRPAGSRASSRAEAEA